MNRLAHGIKLAVLSVVAAGCMSGRLNPDKAKRIEGIPHGYVTLAFPKGPSLPVSIMFTFDVDEDRYIRDWFEAGETLQIPLPAGKHTINYVLRTGLSTGGTFWGGKRNWEITINPGETVKLRMRIELAVDTGFGGANTVTLEVAPTEEAKPLARVTSTKGSEVELSPVPEAAPL
ncbi:MAG: hypothetical protein HY042_06380, partial [Spirochaetia bacterium]|nr:hypothetical protein [Spirochaetia bacterium]